MAKRIINKKVQLNVKVGIQETLYKITNTIGGKKLLQYTMLSSAYGTDDDTMIMLTYVLNHWDEVMKKAENYWKECSIKAETKKEKL